MTIFKWHVEVYAGADALLSLEDELLSLPAVSIDHLGMELASQEVVLRLVSEGVKVKATGFGRIGFDPLPFMKQIYRENPKALMFGTDLPSTRAIKPFKNKDYK